MTAWSFARYASIDPALWPAQRRDWGWYRSPGIPGASGRCPARPGNHPGWMGRNRSAGRRTPAQTGFTGADDRLGPIGDAKLREHGRGVIADRLVGDRELAGDRGIGSTLGDQLEDLALSLG